MRNNKQSNFCVSTLLTWNTADKGGGLRFYNFCSNFGGCAVVGGCAVGSEGVQ